MNPFIHELAEVELGVTVGLNAKIWRFTHIRNGASIGASTIVGASVFIDENVLVGENCKIQNSALLYKGTVVEDFVFIGPGVIFCNDKNPSAVNLDGSLKEEGDWICEGPMVKSRASIGAGSIILPGVIIGERAIIGAGSVVTKSVAPDSVVIGNPATQALN